MRTSNMLERLNRELKRRTRVVCIFPSEASMLRLASAVLMEVDEHWMSGSKYLTMKASRHFRRPSSAFHRPRQFAEQLKHYQPLRLAVVLFRNGTAFKDIDASPAGYERRQYRV